MRVLCILVTTSLLSPTLLARAHDDGDPFHCAPDKTEVGQLIHELREAQKVANEGEDEREGDDYSALEQEVLDALEPMIDDPCGAKILGVTLTEDSKPSPGFAKGRENAYREALQLLKTHGYTFIDEDDYSNHLDRHDSGFGVDARDVRTAEWSASELRRARLVIESLGPWAQDLPVRYFIRDDTSRLVDADGKVERREDTGGVYFYDSSENPSFPSELRIFNTAEAPGCFEHTMAHELMHAYFNKHRNQLNKLGEMVGWTKKGDREAIGKFHPDCTGKKHELHAQDWNDPYNYGFGKPYHTASLHEDSAEQTSYFALGDVAMALASNKCALVLAGGTPQEKTKALEFINRFMPAMPLSKPPTWDGIELTESTRQDVIEKLGEPAEVDRRNDRVELLVWGQTDDGFAHGLLMGDGKAMMVFARAPEEMAVQTLVEQLGEPSLKSETSLYWGDRLYEVLLNEDGEPEYQVFGTLKPTEADLENIRPLTPR